MRITLAERNPEAAAEWSERNLPLTPEDVTYGSDRMVWWSGRCGHEWKAIVKNRSNGAGCPYCTGNRVATGINDLETVMPDLAAQWSPRNTMKPMEVTARSNRKVWWVCEKGHEWKARVADRSAGHGCPYCSGNRPVEREDKGKRPSTTQRRRKLHTLMPFLLVKYYAGMFGMEAVFNSCGRLGISLDAFVPGIPLAINFHKTEMKETWKSEKVRASICERNGITFAVVSGWESEEELAEQIKEAFGKACLVIKTDAAEDVVRVSDRWMAATSESHISFFRKPTV